MTTLIAPPISCPSGRASEAREAFSAALLLDADCLEALCGEAAALDAMSAPLPSERATALWLQARAVPTAAAPPQSSARDQWYVAASRARVALGEAAAAEELLLSRLSGRQQVASCVQAEYATVLEHHYLIDLPSNGLHTLAVPLPAASSSGRDRLSSAHDAWSLVLRAVPGDAHASTRLALVEAELALQSTVEGEDKKLLASALGRLEAVHAASLDSPRVAALIGKVLLLMELSEGVGVPRAIEPPRPPWAAMSSSDDDDDDDDDDDSSGGGDRHEHAEARKKDKKVPSPPWIVVTSFLPHGAELEPRAGGAATGTRAPPLVGGSRARTATNAPPQSRLQRATCMLRTSLALQPADPAAAAVLGIVLCWSQGVNTKHEAMRYLQNCVEMLRERMAGSVASITSGNAPQAPAAAPASAVATALRPPVVAPSAQASVELRVLADIAFDRCMDRCTVCSPPQQSTDDASAASDEAALQQQEGAHVATELAADHSERHDADCAAATREALLAELLGAGQEPESVAAVFEWLGRLGGAPERVDREQWRAAVVAAAVNGAAHDTSEEGSIEGAGAGDAVAVPACRQPGSLAVADKRLHVEGVDTLLLYIGASLYAQYFLVRREYDELPRARAVLRELINLAPTLLRATFEAWGYSRS